MAGVLSGLELAPGCGVMPPGSAPVKILKAKTTMQTLITRFLLWIKTVCRKYAFSQETIFSNGDTQFLLGSAGSVALKSLNDSILMELEK